MKKLVYFWNKALWALISLFFVLFVGFTFLYLYVESQLPNVESLKTVRLQVPLRIYTQDGKLIQEYGEKRRIPLTYDEIPKTLVYALIATEDQRFFEHPGVDILGLSRAALQLIATGTKSQGGSTITMQVARNFFLTRKKTFLRKFNEILLAIKIDRELPKEKILELYLNLVYLGNRAYGVGAAAEIYYGKPLNTLNLAELAVIAGLPQAPSTHNPIANPKAAKKRRDHVLRRLLEQKYITQTQYDEAIKQPITAKYHGSPIEIEAPYVAEMIRQSLYEHFGEQAYTKGYMVYTTIKSPLQLAAHQILVDHLLAYDKRHGYRGPVATTKDLSSNALKKYQSINHLQPAIITRLDTKQAEALLKSGAEVTINWEGISWARPALKKGWMGKAPQQASDVLHTGDIVYLANKDNQWTLSQVPQVEGALVAINPQTGAIEALTGGFDFNANKFNHATQANRQPGSSFKPFLYAAALDKGYTLATLVNDAPIVVDDPSQPAVWRPHNDNKTFGGPMRLREALVHSRNLVSIRVLQDIGIDYAIDFLTRFGFQRKNLPKALSLALGTLSVTPIDLAAAYCIFANGGFKIEPYLIDHMTDSDDKILLQAKPAIACNHCDTKKISSDTLAPRVISEETNFLLTSALKDVVRRGTAHAANVLNRQDLAGKTGTTNERVDAWFAGFNANLVATVWIGYDNPAPLHEYAANLSLPVWIDFMRIALRNMPETTPPQPSNIVTAKINPQTGTIAKTTDTKAVLEYFRQEDLSTQVQEEEDSRVSEPDKEESLF